MASDTASTPVDPGAGAVTGTEPHHFPAQDQREGGRRRRFSTLTWRILAVNALAPLMLAVGLLYLDRYQQSLVRAEIEALRMQAGLMASALGEGATLIDDFDSPRLAPDQARPMVRRFALQTRSRVQLFDGQGQALIDSQLALRAGGTITVLPLTQEPDGLRALAERAYDWVFNALPRRDNFPPYEPQPLADLSNYPEGALALSGDVAAAAYLARDGHLVFTVAMPVQRYRQIIGVLLLSRPSTEIDEALRSIRLDILMLGFGILTLTILMSIYLAGTIARPIRRLALAADRVRRGKSKSGIPDFSNRRDEIGDLSAALGAMTAELYRRLEGTERFAADVAHELKNPLTSLRSAVETAARVEDPEKRARLTQIVLDDCRRMDRLITDISRASRLGAELARAELVPLDMGKMLGALTELYRHGAEESGPTVMLDPVPAGSPVLVLGVEDRLVQVFRNLLANALSFSPDGGVVRLALTRDPHRDGGIARVTVEDDGPGIPPGKEAAIFQRFYSERPKSEKFGTHSGLGLSISQQIVEAHGGTIRAENRLGPDGRVIGARFFVQLPLAPSQKPGAKPAAKSVPKPRSGS